MSPIPLFGWFYVSVLCQTGKRGKKVPQTILASPFTPQAQAAWEKSATNPPGKPLHPPPPLTGNAHMETTHFKKGASLATLNVAVVSVAKYR